MRDSGSTDKALASESRSLSSVMVRTPLRYQGGSGSIIRNDDWSSDIEVVVEIPTADLETGRPRDRPAIEVVAGHRGRSRT